MKQQLPFILLAAVSFLALRANAIEASNRFRSPRNPERRVRASTDLIVLHTTEAPARSSLNKLSDRGEAHFCVTEGGGVYAIVDRDREAFHAGRSMWNGRQDVDKFSVGIECVGYHNKPMPAVQLAAIRTLVKELQAMYRIPDERVVAHSHVAYGMPNRWQRRNHRGRKRCGMLFAMPSVRRQLRLRPGPSFDPDTRTRRLVVGDEYLCKVLYGGADPMAAAYRSGAGASSAPAQNSIFSGIARWGKQPTATPQPKAASPPQRTNKSPKTTKTATRQPAVALPERWKQRSSGSAPKASASSVPRSIAELKNGGWKLKGTVSQNTSASKIAGSAWNAPSTYYTIRDRVIPGNRIDASHIERGMGVWLKK